MKIFNDKNYILSSFKEYLLITLSIILIVIGTYFFKFPNNFTFGGVTGFAIPLSKLLSLSPSTINFILNIAILVMGFILLGKKVLIRTAYASIILSIGLSLCEKLFPLSNTLTDDPLLELIFAIVLPGFGAAILFNINSSSGGTDIIALILKKFFNTDIGNCLLISDVIITLTSFFLFDIKTALFSTLGLIGKSIVIDTIIEGINRVKYCNIVSTNPKIICDYINTKLKRSATICNAKGAFSGNDKFVILTVVKRHQAVRLRQFVKKVDKNAFITITNTSEIIGRGFS